MFDVQSLLHNIRIRSWIALVSIGVFISIAFAILSQQSQIQQGRAEMINIAGQQRMLSQKITLYATRHLRNISTNSLDTNIQEILRATSLLMQENQTLLTQAASTSDALIPTTVLDLYTKQSQLNNRVMGFSTRAIALAQHTSSNGVQPFEEVFLATAHVEALLHDLDLAVKYLEQDTTQREKEIERTKQYLWACLLLLLVMIGLYIFRPIRHGVNNTYQQLVNEKHKVSDYRFAMDKHALVCQFDLGKDIISVNDIFSELLGYSNEELKGKPLSLLFSDTHGESFIDEIYHSIESGNVWRGSFCNKAKSGRYFWFNTTIVPLNNTDEESAGYMMLQNDITEQVTTEDSLRQLHVVTANSTMSLSEKISALLKQGKALYQLPLAIVSQVSGDEYKVMYSDTPNGEVSPGDTFVLGNTYCYHTLMANQPTAYHHTANSEIKNHPCYQNFGLESYIGAPIFVGNKRFGTLNFSSPEKYPHPFKHSDLELIQLIAQWIGFELERHEQQEHLIGQQQLMSQMSQLANIGAWEVDLIAGKITWSSMTKAIHEVPMDYEPDLTTALNFYKEGASRDRITALVEASISEGMPYHDELQLITAKGNEIWVAAKGESEFENGKCIRLFGSFQDITKQKKADLELQDYSRRMTLATDSAGIGIWELNLLTNSLKWDEWMFRLYGVEASEFSGAYEAWEQGVHPDDVERSARELQDAIDGGPKFDAQFRIVWPDGTIRYIKADAIVMKDSQGEPVSMIGVNYDVTERVENELALTKAKLAAEAGSRAKNEFLASMSHEIRTPMNGVIGMLDLVKDTPLSSEQSHRITIAQSSANSLLHLINDILDFSKIDADKLALEAIDFDLCTMMGELAESFASQIESKSIDLIIDTVEVRGQHINGDPSRIRQILTNLLSNSIKFTSSGEVLVSARVIPHTDKAWVLELKVKDTGIGIAQDKQSQLFDSFSQVDASTTREYGGTGLGLAIVKKLCQRMGGDITVESLLNKGSCFTCQIQVGATHETVNMNKGLLVDKHILIVDSNATNATMMKNQLAQWGAKCVIANGMSDGWEYCISPSRDQQPLIDLLIVDVNLPDNEGTLLLEKVASTAITAPIKVALMTSMHAESWANTFKQINCVASFPKPVTVADFKALSTAISADGTLKRAVQLDQKPLDNEQPSRIDSRDAQETIPATSSSAVDQVMEWPEACKILLVEDNRVNQMVAKGVLTKIGLECEIAVNGQDALDKLSVSDNLYDLILMDIQMPVMDGYEATQRIRAGEAGAHCQDISIIAMTANAMRGDREKCLQAGMNDYLAKPINKDAVIDKLSFWLCKKEEQS